MLSVFPIMFLSLLAHAILRVIAGGILISMSSSHLRALRAPGAPKATLVTLASIELILGGAFIIGFLTQVAALGIAILSVGLLIFGKRLAIALPSPAFFVLLIGASLSLVITGAGVLAIDMPF